MKRAFADLFGRPDTLNLTDFVFLLRIEQSHGIRLKEGLPPPFPRTTFPTSGHLSAFWLFIEPTLARPLPIWINGMVVTGGDLQSPTSVTLSTLQETDLDAFRDLRVAPRANPSARDYKNEANDILDMLRESRRRGCDFFAWSG